MPSSHLILCHPLLLLPSIFASISVFSNESVLCIRWPKYWSFSFSISPSNDYSGLISFRIDWFNLLVVQGRGRLWEQLEPGGCNSSELTRPCLPSLFPLHTRVTSPTAGWPPLQPPKFPSFPCGPSILREVLINNRKLSLSHS